MSVLSNCKHPEGDQMGECGRPREIFGGYKAPRKAEINIQGTRLARDKTGWCYLWIESVERNRRIV